MPQPRLPAVKRLVAVLALEVQRLPLVNHLDVFPQIEGLAETLGTVVAHEPALMSRLFVPTRKDYVHRASIVIVFMSCIPSFSPRTFIFGKNSGIPEEISRNHIQTFIFLSVIV